MHHLIDLAATLLAALTLEGPAAEDGAKVPEAHERFEELDRNDDGRIVLAEYVHGRKGAKALAAAKRFKKMDTDGNGGVTAEEFAAARDAAKQK